MCKDGMMREKQMKALGGSLTMCVYTNKCLRDEGAT